jgi:hypothetical protein
VDKLKAWLLGFNCHSEATKELRCAYPALQLDCGQSEKPCYATELRLDHYTGPPVLGESHRLLEISFGHNTISALVKPSPFGS